MEIWGYARPDGQIGIRNHIVVIYSVECAKVVACKIADQFAGIHVFGRRTGCDWSQPIFDKLVALGRHPNVAAVLVVGLGCEYMEAPLLAAEIAKSGKPSKSLVITEVGGTLKGVEAGSRIVKEMLKHVYQVPRVPIQIEELVVAMDCAGSDATSGLASNPAVGVAADLLVQAGGTVYFFNIYKELVGLADVLASRAANQEVADSLRQVVPDIKPPRPDLGNIRGGLTTYREKAAGALAKGGSTPIKGLVNTFQRPGEPGLYLEVLVPGSYEGTSDPQCAMQMAACGAHIVVETTGVGTVTGGVVAPVIKVCANPKTCARLADDMDIDASAIMTGAEDIQEVGERIRQEILAVAAGKQTRAEVLGHFED